MKLPGYARGYADGLARASEQIAALQTQLAESYRQRDVLTDKLIQQVGYRALTQAGREAATQPSAGTQLFGALDKDPLDELALTDPRGRFRRPEDALIDPAAREPLEGDA